MRREVKYMVYCEFDKSRHIYYAVFCVGRDSIKLYQDIKLNIHLEYHL